MVPVPPFARIDLQQSDCGVEAGPLRGAKVFFSWEGRMENSSKWKIFETGGIAGKPAPKRLAEAAVVAIRTRRAAGEKATGLAAEFGVSTSLISQVCTGLIWADAPGPLSRKHRDRRVPAADRFWEQVAKADPDECWPWTGGLDADDYGLLYVDGKNVQAIRFALELRLKRALTSDEVARHTCHNRPCCNPTHLVPGSIADNNADKVQAGRQARGEGIATAKLTEDDVREIRSLVGSVSFAELARRFGVSDRAVRYAATGERWKHLCPSTEDQVRRQSLGAKLLEEHARNCPPCTEAAKANRPLTALCAAGRLLAEVALKARGRRAA